MRYSTLVGAVCGIFIAVGASQQGSAKDKCILDEPTMVDQLQIEAVYTSPLYRRCDLAVRDLERLMISSGVRKPQFYDWIHSIVESDKESEGSEILKLVEQYDLACGVSPLNFRTGWPAESVKRILERLVVFVDRGPQGTIPYCMGFDDGEYVYTARHCLALPGRRLVEGLDRASRVGHSMQQTATAIFFGNVEDSKNRGQTVELVVEGAKHPSAYRNWPDAYFSDAEYLADDWIGLARPMSIHRLDQADKAEQRKSFQELMVITVDGYAVISSIRRRLLAGGADEDLEMQLQDIISSLRFQYSGQCRSVGTSAKMLFHNCLLDSGMSGTPLFTEEEVGMPAFVGLHAGAIEKMADLCQVEAGAVARNYGVVPN